jgi:predicted O-linked N-acetylglucosamine transferase (SPINDLY family)
VGAALALAAGGGAGVSRTLQDYTDVAARLGTNAGARAVVRKGLARAAACSGGLFDARATVRSLERVMRLMWERLRAPGRPRAQRYAHLVAAAAQPL